MCRIHIYDMEFHLAIYFQGSWPACVSAGVLLYTKARRFGMSLAIHVVDEHVEEQVLPPSMFHSPLLVALGLPHSQYDSSTVIIPGESDAPGLMKLENQWYSIDRSGNGFCAETIALLQILHSQRAEDIRLRQSLLGFFQQLGIRPEPGLFDLFFSMSSLEDKIAVLLKLGVGQTGGMSVYELFHTVQQSYDSSVLELWKQRTANSILHEVLCSLEIAWKDLNLSNISVYASNEMMGIQRGFVEFLGAAGVQKHPLAHMREQYTFLGGKFVSTMGKGLCYRFAETKQPTQNNFWNWLIEQAQIGADSVEPIWKRYTEPEQ